MNPTLQNVPASLGYKNFLKYAPSIGLALRSYPSAIAVLCTQSVNTFAARCRDARRGKAQFGYTSPDIDEKLFQEHAFKFQFVLGIGKVYIGTLNAIQQLRAEETKNPDAQSSTPSASTDVRFTYTDKTELYMLCELISKKLFNPSPSIILHVGEREMDYMRNVYDVEFISIDAANGLYKLI